MMRKEAICFNIFSQFRKMLACPNRLSVLIAIDVMSVCMKMECVSLLVEQRRFYTFPSADAI